MSRQPATMNTLGHPIYEIDDTERLQRAWLRDLEWPRDVKIITRLSRDDFRNWVYGLNPQMALLLASHDKTFYRVQNRKRNWITLFFDWVWRKRHGYR